MEHMLLRVMPVVFACVSVKIWCMAAAPNIWLWVVKSEGSHFAFFFVVCVKRWATKDVELLLLTDSSTGPKACFLLMNKWDMGQTKNQSDVIKIMWSVIT